MQKYEIIFFAKDDGTQPAIEYIKSLSAKMRAKIAKVISLLSENGSYLRMPYSEYLRDGIFQIRIQQEGNISRVLYFFAVGKKIIFTNGFTKKTPATPQSEIDTAKRYRDQYEYREDGAQ